MGSLALVRRAWSSTLSMPRMRSESRTEETSGLVTTSASSAKCIASSAPDLDARGRIADDVVEAHRGEFVEHLLDAFLRERVLVARLRGRQHEQVLALLVLDQRLVQVGFALDHVDQVVHHAALAAHDQVEVAQADVEVDHGRLVGRAARAPMRSSRSWSSCRRRPCPKSPPRFWPLPFLLRSFQLFCCAEPDQRIGFITIFLPSSEICAVLPAMSSGSATSEVR